jgi:hypothetical protein
MPIGEVLLAMVGATVAAIVVLWLRRRGRDPWTESDAPQPTIAEPGLSRVLEIFALAAALRVAIDHLA